MIRRAGGMPLGRELIPRPIRRIIPAVGAESENSPRPGIPPRRVP